MATFALTTPRPSRRPVVTAYADTEAILTHAAATAANASVDVSSALGQWEVHLVGRGGSFVIDGLSGLTDGRPVWVQQAASDAAELDAIVASGRVVSDSSIRVYWKADADLAGVVTFDYQLS